MQPLQHGARINHGTPMGKELYRTEDDEGSIIVTQRGNKRLLNSASILEQSSVLMGKPYYLIHEYTQIMLLGLVFVDARHMTLFGLGGGLVHSLSHYYPQSTIHVVEIRQAVIDIAHDWFDLPRLDNLGVVNDDAMNHVSKLTQGSTDIIFSALYEAEGMAACQQQQEFIVACYQALCVSGCLVLNFHDKPHRGSLLMDTIESFFNEIIVYDSDESEVNWRAECMTKRVKMPLMHYYCHLSFI